VAGAAILAVSLYLTGVVAQKLWDFPAPVVMLLLTVLLKLGRLVSPDLEAGAYSVYRFFRVAVTYPLLFAIGVAMTPWDKLVAAFNAPTLATIVATVATLIGVGFLTGRLLRMYPVDVAIVTACHSGQGGTGDVAILSAANRMQLMPFAQIATRIGGAITVTLALIAFRALGS
jgi:Na+/citrate or Na+/malate symporter